MHRRELLRSAGLAALGVGFAGCSGSDDAGTTTDGDGGTDAETETGTDTATPADDSAAGASVEVAAKTAVAAEWNAMRGRLYDAVALGIAGEADAGAAVAADVFERFETASGEWGAHERLERASERRYESFEDALGSLSEALSEGNLANAAAFAANADGQLAAAQSTVVPAATADAFTLQTLGVRAANAALVAGADAPGAAVELGERVMADFEDSPAHDAVEAADAEAYEAFETGLSDLVSAAKRGDAAGVETGADAAVSAAVAGSYALTAERAAGAGHLATMQDRGFDAAALAGLGGPGTGVAHAVALTTYRARVHDAARLAAAGGTDAAARMVKAVFAHFEGARAHEALEEADGEAYEGFERGLEALSNAVATGDETAADEALATVDANLVAGILALAGGAAPVVEAAFLRARLADALELFHRGEGDAAASVVESVFQRFEADEAGVHEALEDESEALYEAFEEEHLPALQTAFAAGNGDAVETHYHGVTVALRSFATKVGADAAVAATELGFLDARAFDAATLATQGQEERPEDVVGDAFSAFERDQAGVHEALEHADGETYEAFESELGGLGGAITSGEDVAAQVRRVNAESVAGVYAIVAVAGGSFADAAGSLARGVFGDFEEARVHDLLEEADHDAYEAFESELDGLVAAVGDGTNVDAAASAYADATLRAQFAVVGAAGNAPVGEASGGSGDETETGLQGGPNVVSGVPGDADHVVDVKAVSFAPADLTVKAGDTVAFEHAAGEAHTVTARADGVPDGADYWASGGFDSQSAAETGWENGTGAVQSGQSYVHTFETVGEHAYFCIPHEAAGMEGTVVVEE